MRPRRQDDGGSLLGTIWCGTLGIILIWLLVITIVFSLLIWDAHNRLDNFERRLDRADEAIEENEECCTEITDTVDEFRPCLEGYCDPSNFPRLLDAVICKGCWNANNNFPSLASGVGTNGDLYHVCVAGVTDIEGVTDWEVGDTLKFIENTPSGPRWIKNDGSPEVIPPPPDVLITLNNLGDASDGEVILDDPGTDDDFSFKRIKGGLGIFTTTTAESVSVNLDLRKIPADLFVTYLAGNDVDAVNGDADFIPHRLHYYRVRAFCNAGARIVTCGTAESISNTVPPLDPPPAGQDRSRPQTSVWVHGVVVSQVADSCSCTFAVPAVRTGGVDTSIGFFCEAICIDPV